MSRPTAPDRVALPRSLPPRRCCPVVLALALAVAGLAGSLLAPLAGAEASAAQSQERTVTAAFLNEFLGYTEFPGAALGEAGAPVIIGVVDADELAAERMRFVSSRTVMARPTAAKRLREQESPHGVHPLFIGGTDRARVRQVLSAAQREPMLLGTEAENGLRQDSIINFRIIDGRVRLDASLDASDKHSVKLSSPLLTVAHLVSRGAR